MTTHFDANAMVESMERPTLTCGKHQFVGRNMGIEEFMGFAPRLAKLQSDDFTIPDLKRLIRLFTDALFPKPPWWAPWRPWAVVELGKMPLQIQVAALNHFIHCQRSVLGLPPADPTPPPEGEDPLAAAQRLAPPPTPPAASNA